MRALSIAPRTGACPAVKEGMHAFLHSTISHLSGSSSKGPPIERSSKPTSLGMTPAAPSSDYAHRRRVGVQAQGKARLSRQSQNCRADSTRARPAAARSCVAKHAQAHQLAQLLRAALPHACPSLPEAPPTHLYIG